MALIPRCAHTGNLLFSFLGAHLNVLPKEGDPPGRPYENLYYFYERNLVLIAHSLQGRPSWRALIGRTHGSAPTKSLALAAFL